MTNYRTMLLSGNCFYLTAFKNHRVQGPVDNILTKSDVIAKLLLENNFLIQFKKEIPEEVPRIKNFAADSSICYHYCFGDIVHNNPYEEKFIQTLSQRVENFNNFKGIYIVILNDYDVNEDGSITDNIKNLISYLKEKQLLQKTLFVEIYAPTHNPLRHWKLLTTDFNLLVEQYNLYHITIDDRELVSLGSIYRHIDNYVNECGILKGDD